MQLVPCQLLLPDVLALEASTQVHQTCPSSHVLKHGLAVVHAGKLWSYRQIDLESVVLQVQRHISVQPRHSADRGSAAADFSDN